MSQVNTQYAYWAGRVYEVIADLHEWEVRVSPPPEGQKPADDDPRKIVHDTARYLANNRNRMDYAGYRRWGLPVTSSQAESLVKQVGRRVKGPEKVWNDGPSGEAILQIRAAVISDGERLRHWIGNRPISPFLPRCHCPPQVNGA